MKLTKRKLIQLTQKQLSLLGYHYVVDTITTAQGLYLKRTSDSLFLSLGLTISKYYDSMFTASYYLSTTTNWAAVWGDIPNRSYVRIGHFLTQEEREFLLDKQQIEPGIRDAWWDANNIDNLDCFFNAVSITESRFISQPNLTNDIIKSAEVIEMNELARRTMLIVGSDSHRNDICKFTPLKPVDNIAIDWFKAAEQAIVEMGSILNENTVKRVAADAYRRRIV